MGFSYYSVQFHYCHNKYKTQVDLWDPTRSHIDSLSIHSHRQFSFSFSSEESFPPASCKLFYFLRRGIRGDPISLHLLIPKSSLVSMRNRQECVSLTFFVECICTSCSSNLKQPTASLIESSPWRLLSGAQVSSKEAACPYECHKWPHVWGCDPLRWEERIQISLARL